MTKIFIFILALGFPLLVAEAEVFPKYLSLSSGKILEVDGYVSAWLDGSKEHVLILRYEVFDIEDTEKLDAMAKIIWESMKPIAEERGYKNSAIKAVKYSGPKVKFVPRTFKAYTRVITKNSGIWEFLEADT